MKKFLFVFFILIAAVAPNVWAGTSEWMNGMTTIYATSQNNTTYFDTGTNLGAALTDNSNTTTRIFANNGAVTGNFGGRQLIDGYQYRRLTTGAAFNFRLILYNASFGVVYDNNISLSYTTTTLGGSIANTGAYYFKLVNIAGQNVSLSEFYLTQTPDVTAPANVSISSATTGNLSVTLNWTKPGDEDLAGYKIYRNNVLQTTIASPDTLTYTQSGLTATESYTYKVSSYDISGNEATGTTTTITAVDKQAPTWTYAGAAITATSADNAVIYTWNAATDNVGIANYQLFRVTDLATQATVNGSTLTYTRSGLTNNVSPGNWRMKACDAAGNCTSQAIYSGSEIPTDTVDPTTPTVTASNIGESTATLNWTDSTSIDASFYDISASSTFATYTRITDTNYKAASNLVTYSTNLTGLLNDSSVTYYIRAVDDDTRIGSTNSVTFSTVPNPPNVPTGLAVTPGDRSLSYSWNQSSESDRNGYRFRLSPSGSPLTNAIDVNTRTVTGLTNNQEYCYQVAAVDVLGNLSAYSSAVCGTPVDNTPTGPPTSVTGDAGNMKVTVSWSAPVGGTDLDKYKVYEVVAGSNVLRVTTPNKFTTSAEFSTAVGVTRTFFVTAIDDDNNESDASSTVQATAVDTEPPTKPTSFAATEGDKQIYLSWSASTDNDKVDGYQVAYYIITFGDGSAVTTTNTYYTFTGLTNNQLYNFQVKAYDPSGNYSLPATIQATPTDGIAPVAPTLSAGTVGETSIEITFPDSSSADNSSYEVSRFASFNPKQTIPDTNAAIYSATFSGLSSLTNYTFYIRAIDDDTNVSTVNTLTVSTIAVPPPVPSGLTVLAADNQLTYSWAEITGVGDLSAYRLKNQATGATVNVASTSRTFTGLTNLMSYCYSVAAYDIWGNLSAYSDEICGMPTDNVNPEPVTNITAAGEHLNINVSWTASTSADAVGYKIYLIGTGSPVLVKNIDNKSTVSADFPQATIGVSKTYGIVTVDDDGNLSDLSTTASASAVDLVAPTVPTNLTTTSTDKQVTLSWSNSSDEIGVASYSVKKNGTFVDTTNGTSYVFTGLTNATSYTFSVAATDTSGNTSSYASKTATPLDNISPAVPSDVTATEGDNRIIYSWSENTEDDFVNYKFYAFGETTPIYIGNLESYTVSGLTNGVEYCYQVSAIDSSGNESAKSAKLCKTPIDIYPPFDVSTVSPVSGSEYSFTFTFSDSTSSDVIFYKIYKQPDGGSKDYIGQVDDVVGATTYTYTATDLTPGILYSFTVNPVDDDEFETAAGTSGTVTYTPTASPPSTPTGLTATAASDSITFSWSGVSDPDLAGYKLFMKEGSSYTLLATYAGSGTSALYVPPTSDAYLYVLAAYDTGGTLSGYSTPVTAAILSKPPLFSGLPIGASDIVESGLSLVGLFKWFIILGLAIWLVYKLLYLMRNANQTPQTAGANVEEKPVKRRRTKQEIEADRKIKKEIREEKERINKIKTNVRSKLSKSVGYKIYKKE